MSSFRIPPRSRPALRILRRATVTGASITLAVAGLTVVQTMQAPQAQARSTFTAPLMGWSSWSVESTTHPNYGVNWLTEGNVKNAADALSTKLKSAGYQYIDIDSYWSNGQDGNGIPSADTGRFPSGMAALATYIHNDGLKMGIYDGVGLPPSVYNNNAPIVGTSCHTRDIAVQPLTATNMWGSAWKINYGNSCAQAYINSVVAKYASWGMDMIKVDGVTTDNVVDIQAFSKAIDQSGRQMWLTASAWPVNIAAADGLSPYANSVRVDTDVECYCDTVSSWGSSTSARWTDLPQWLSHLNSSYRPDLDSMPINNNTGTGVQDGLNDTERQSVMNFWSMASSPLYVGGDIYFMDSKAISILSNPEVIAVDQSSIKPSQVTAGTLQVWRKVIGSSTYVAVYNLGTSSANITVNWSSVGVSGSAIVRDVDARGDLGTFNGSWTASNVPSHGSRLIKIN